MTFTPRCASCGLYGDEGCYRRFAKSHGPKYRYEKRKVGQGVTPWCVDIMPRPRPIADPQKDSCSDWRDPSGHSEEQVRAAMRAAH
jgi:hypothetical protein